ncbi:MAG TPA: hypothetical protein VF014_04625, partial [Casimicrobiaceae bacterium]|nr:hypothetical protein [Casimicrobiaceae bacterium]
MRMLKSLGALALLAVFVSSPARAFVWNEVNAGQLPATAEVIFGGGPLTQINGHLDFDIDTLTWDVDLFAIQI